MACLSSHGGIGREPSDWGSPTFSNELEEAKRDSMAFWIQKIMNMKNSEEKS
jgi:hypothetical protein